MSKTIDEQKTIDTTLPLEKRKDFLRYCADLYETGTSPISDAEWDNEYRALQTLDPTFSITGGKTDTHYAEQYIHEYEMGSLFKDKSPEEFEKWFAKTYPNTKGMKAILDFKIDGCSICCHYDANGKLLRVVSRGDGKIGCVMPHGKHIKGVLEKIKATGAPIEIKGECYKNQQDFISEGWNAEYANARNFTSPITTLKDEEDVKKRNFSFVAYEIRGKKFDTEIEKINFLEELGFETLKDSLLEIDCDGKTAADISKIVKNYMDKTDRENLKFAIDGVVFKNMSIAASEALGVTDRRPKGSRAIKFPTDQKETKLIGISWQIGRIGALTPVGLLEPVQLAGTSVQKVSLHNLAELKRLGLTHYGCKVLVEKAGDIIPKLVRITDNVVGNSPVEIEIPTICPVCESELEMDSNGITKWCRNELCQAKISKNIEHWFKKLNVKGIGEGIINKLCTEEMNSFDEPVVSSISDMYSLSHYKSELETVFGPKAFDNILKAVASVTSVSLGQFVEALGVAQIGRMSHDIAKVAKTIEGVDKLTVEDIIKLQGFSSIKANKFVDGWKTMRNSGEIDNLLKYITIEEKVQASSTLEGKSFCVTGALSKSRKEVVADIEANGGVIKSSVGKSLNYLVAGENAGSKIDKAKKNGVSIITEEELIEMMK